jgi:hypothetical protein
VDSAQSLGASLQQFAAYYYNRAAQWGKGMAVNYKYEAFATGSAVFDIERGKSPTFTPIFGKTTPLSPRIHGVIPMPKTTKLLPT